MKRLIPALILAALTASAYPFSPSQGTLNPGSGDLFGLPGQTVVWGVDLKNDTNDWWIFTSVQSDYTSTGAPGEIPDGPGFFTDYLSVNFLIEFVGNARSLVPKETYSEGGGADPFDLPQVGTPGVDAVGLASFAISPTALPGSVSAQIHVTYDIYDGNPFGTGNYIGSDQIDINTSVTVPSPAPEPGTMALIAAALGVFAIARRLKQSSIPVTKERCQVIIPMTNASHH
jgi:hypothetical protein